MFERIEIQGSETFLRHRSAFLGHKISADRMSPDIEKVWAIYDFPKPTNVSELRSFIGLISYNRKFIKSFDNKAVPLNKLLKKGVKFTWDSECECAFQEFKVVLTSSPILRYPDFSLPFVPDNDACDTGIGARTWLRENNCLRKPSVIMQSSKKRHSQLYGV